MKVLLRTDVKDQDSSDQCPSVTLNFQVLNLNTNSLLTEISNDWHKSRLTFITTPFFTPRNELVSWKKMDKQKEN